jgi:hypothetical protein
MNSPIMTRARNTVLISFNLVCWSLIGVQSNSQYLPNVNNQITRGGSITSQLMSGSSTVTFFTDLCSIMHDVGSRHFLVSSKSNVLPTRLQHLQRIRQMVYHCQIMLQQAYLVSKSLVPQFPWADLFLCMLVKKIPWGQGSLKQFLASNLVLRQESNRFFI